MMFDNQLSAAQVERLAILAEECGEVVQIVGKILRHGYGSFNPTVPLTEQRSNRKLLENELADTLWIISKMDEAVDLDFEIPTTNASLNSRMRRKGMTAAPYLHHQPVKKAIPRSRALGPEKAGQ